MKIGINTLFYIPGEVGGSETYLLEILRKWKTGPFHHEIVLFTQKENHQGLFDEFSGAGWSFVCCPFKARNRVVRIVREQLELPWKVKKTEVDVLWSPGYTAPLLGFCPQVVSILDMQYKSFPQDLSFVGRWTTEILVQLACRKAKKILTISQFSKKEILKFTRARPDQVEVTLLAASADFIPDEVAEVEKASPPTLLCVANTYPHKNVDQLVRAFVRLEDEIAHDLVIIGKPRLGEAEYMAAVRSLKNPDRLIRKQGLSRDQLVGEYFKTDLFVFPSLYEGFGLPVLEAMLAGTPVLTTRCGSIPEVGGGFVHYYDHQSDQSLADEIKNCLAKVRENADSDARKEWLDPFRWSETAEKTLKVLESLL